MNEINPNIEIEPELLGACPRRVVSTKRTLFMRRLAWNGGLAILCLICFLASRDIKELDRSIKLSHEVSGYGANAIETACETGDSQRTVYCALHPAEQATDGLLFVRSSSTLFPEARDHFRATYPHTYTSVDRYDLVEPESIESRELFWICVAMVSSAIYLVVVWLISASYAQQKHLLQFGLAESAIVRGRRIVNVEDGTAYVLTYTYRLADRKQRIGVMYVSKTLYEAYPEGRKFSILVDRANRRHSKPYFGFHSYKILDAPKRSFL